MLKQWLHRARGHATTRIPVTVFTPRYAPELDGDPDPGEVVWAWIPYEDDPQQGKDRPVIVVGWDEKDLVVVPLTTKAHPERDDEVEGRLGRLGPHAAGQLRQGRHGPAGRRGRRPTGGRGARPHALRQGRGRRGRLPRPRTQEADPHRAERPPGPHDPVLVAESPLLGALH
jgi:hypothetical protein